ncbi:MAG: 8-amino-7-oxononanoate synthase [Alphaproteobacteria bacterium]|nr:8-amino-7-oxononanoate synthase [Alphaproteobacteria bacterium]
MSFDPEKTIEQLKSLGRYRRLTLPCGLDLSSNDYLGMADHPALREAALSYFGNEESSVGSGGSRLLRGHAQAHQDLEDYAAQVFGCERTLFFPTGFQANYALLTTLPQRGDVVLYDNLVHASMRDGLVACRAKSFKFPHNDMNALEDLLKRYRGKAQNIWVCAESVYSMEGDQAPLLELYKCAERYDAMLIIDEAHATGVLGEDGRGLVYDAICKNKGYEHIVTLYTCGKAMGVAGAIICSNSGIIDYMVNTSRPFIFSTAPMPVQAVLVQKSLEIILSTDGAARREKLHKICRYTQQLLGGHGGHIVPIILGEDSVSVDVAEQLQNKGYDIRAIRPPAVPAGTARLRLSLSAKLKRENIREFVNAFEDIRKAL